VNRKKGEENQYCFHGCWCSSAERTVGFYFGFAFFAGWLMVVRTDRIVTESPSLGPSATNLLRFLWWSNFLLLFAV